MFNWLKKVNLKIIFGEKILLLFFLVGLLLNTFIWIFLFLSVKSRSEPIPLHYNIYFGIDLIGKIYKLFFLPFFGLLVIFINYVVSSIVYKREKILSYFLMSITVFTQAILVLAMILISYQSI
jgi:vacuolar-type H+-ATPase subunit I/STV1